MEHIDIPWRHTAEMRNVASYDDFRTDLDMVWEVVDGPAPARDVASAWSLPWLQWRAGSSVTAPVNWADDVPHSASAQ